MPIRRERKTGSQHSANTVESSTTYIYRPYTQPYLPTHSKYRVLELQNLRTNKTRSMVLNPLSVVKTRHAKRAMAAVLHKRVDGLVLDPQYGVESMVGGHDSTCKVRLTHTTYSSRVSDARRLGKGLCLLLFWGCQFA